MKTKQYLRWAGLANAVLMMVAVWMYIFGSHLFDHVDHVVWIFLSAVTLIALIASEIMDG